METKVKNFVNIEKNSISKNQTQDDVVNFAEPLAITDDSRQWNNTCYDISTLDISSFDGVITANHSQKIEDVIGKVVNLRKEGNKILIDGVKFAINENPLAVLAKNLLVGGFVTGFSIETIGGDPDDSGVWRNHRLCGLSQVGRPNNLNAYAVVANSINEAKTYGLKTEKLESIIDKDIKSKVERTSKRLNNIQNSLKF